MSWPTFGQKWSSLWKSPKIVPISIIYPKVEIMFLQVLLEIIILFFVVHEYIFKIVD